MDLKVKQSCTNICIIGKESIIMISGHIFIRIQMQSLKNNCPFSVFGATADQGSLRMI